MYIKIYILRNLDYIENFTMINFWCVNFLSEKDLDLLLSFLHDQSTCKFLFHTYIVSYTMFFEIKFLL